VRADASEYDLVSPGSLDAVLALLAQAPGEWTPIAGGTELMVQFGAGRLRARKLVNIFGLPELTAITVTDEAIRIGAGVTYTAIRKHAELGATLPLLARAASWTGSIANQNRGTLGGNLVNGSPAADSPPALLAYEASVELISVRGTRTIAYAGFHTGYKKTVLAPDELVLSVVIPRPAEGLRQYLRKVGPRNAMAISKVALAAVATLDGSILRRPRIGLASVSHAPFRCLKTEAALTDAAFTPALIAQARAALVGEIAPLDDIRSTGKYRAHVAANLLEEFLTQLATA
jgi:CO/xanthine dehydrogenase FAD-binding subunit